MTKPFDRALAGVVTIVILVFIVLINLSRLSLEHGSKRNEEKQGPTCEGGGEAFDKKQHFSCQKVSELSLYIQYKVKLIQYTYYILFGIVLQLNKEFVQSSSLQRHIRHVHERVRIYQCKMVGQTFY